jgi:hypothetical protein
MKYMLYHAMLGPLESEEQPTGVLRDVGPVTVIKKNGEGRTRYRVLFEEGTKRVWALPEEHVEANEDVDAG